MRWMVLPASVFARDAQRAGESVPVGRSGHAHALMSAARVFRRFRLELCLLISLVWLVEADHHSVHEVVNAARHHGLRTPALANSMWVARAALRRVNAQWAADCGPGRAEVQSEQTGVVRWCTVTYHA